MNAEDLKALPNDALDALSKDLRNELRARQVARRRAEYAGATFVKKDLAPPSFRALRVDSIDDDGSLRVVEFVFSVGVALVETRHIDFIGDDYFRVSSPEAFAATIAPLLDFVAKWGRTS